MQSDHLLHGPRPDTVIAHRADIIAAQFNLARDRLQARD
jgi:hypothetical protein